MHEFKCPDHAIEFIMRRRGKLHIYEQLVPTQTALVVVDMQSAFVGEGAAIETPAARGIVPNSCSELRDKIPFARKRGAYCGLVRVIPVQCDSIMVRPMNSLHSICRRYAVSIILTLGYFLAGCAGSDDPLERFRAGDYEASLKLFGPRADAGDPAARNFIGIHYYLGLGADRDLAAAAKWFEQAALAQNADAQRNLGVMYLRGFGVERDYGQAYGWLYHAYVGGNRTAERYLGFTGDLITPNASMQARKRVGAQIKAAATQRPATAR